MNPPLAWKSAFRTSADPLAVDLVSRLCVFTHAERLRGYESLLHPFFDQLRGADATLPNGKGMPPLFQFTRGEAPFIRGDLLRQLVPAQRQIDTWFIERKDYRNIRKSDDEAIRRTFTCSRLTQKKRMDIPNSVTGSGVLIVECIRIFPSRSNLSIFQTNSSPVK
jgi:hypothetical protein